MFSLLPGSPPAETLGAYAVLALIADPAAAKKRLDELTKAAKAAADQGAEASTLHANATRLADEAKAMQTDAQATAERNAADRAELDKAKADIAAQRADLEQRERQVAEEKKAQERDAAALARKITAHETAVAATQDRLAREAAALSDARLELEKRLTKLRELAG